MSKLISKLPEPYQLKAKLNRANLPSGRIETDALIGAFTWHDSPEGHKFWSDVDKAKSESELPEVTYDGKEKM